MKFPKRNPSQKHMNEWNKKMRTACKVHFAKTSGNPYVMTRKKGGGTKRLYKY